jgi:hypothetical protein
VTLFPWRWTDLRGDRVPEIDVSASQWGDVTAADGDNLGCSSIADRMDGYDVVGHDSK